VLALEIDEALIIGSSWGGALALQFSTTGFPVRGVVLLGAEIQSDETLQNGLMNLYTWPVIGRVISETIGAPVAPSIAQHKLGRALGLAKHEMNPKFENYLQKAGSRFAVQTNIRDTAYSEQAMFNSMRQFWNDETRKSMLGRIPVTAVFSQKDRIVAPSRHSEVLNDYLPHAAVIRLTGAGHQLHITDRDVVSNSVIFTDDWAERGIAHRPDTRKFGLPLLTDTTRERNKKRIL
jgi:pimeloyl-ACP methyl ester carboxylesterase